MSGLKQKIKGVMPKRLLYMYSCVRLIPDYCIAKLSGNKYKGFSVDFYSDIETVDMIVNKGKSLARFGDGEFAWMNGIVHESFQDYSQSLGTELFKAFDNDNPKLLIGIPIGFFDSKKCNLHAKMHWEIMRGRFLDKAISLLGKHDKYSNASITRPYIDYKSREFSRRSFENLRRIWDKRDIVIVEGEYSKLGVGNNLFDNALSIKRILCPARNAYSRLEDIEATIRKEVDKDILILGALGPTATILASRLCDDGYQFVDVGHVDIEYVWYLNHAIVREPIKGKYVNECGKYNQYNCQCDEDAAYVKSIICRI